MRILTKSTPRGGICSSRCLRGGARVGALTTVLLCVLAMPAAASLDVTYELEGESLLPVASLVYYIQLDPLTGTGEEAPYSTGTFSVQPNLFESDGETLKPPREALYINLNGEVINCMPSTPETPPGSRTCDTPMDGLIEYLEPPPTIQNTMTVRFDNADASGLGSIGAGQVEIVDLDWFTNVRTPNGINNPINFDSIIIVAGISYNKFDAAIGTMDAQGVVGSWTTDLTGLNHSEVMCSGAICTGQGLTGEELVVLEDAVTEPPIEVTGDWPDTCVTSDGNCDGLPDNVLPGSESMTFTNDFQDVTFSVFQREIDATIGGQSLTIRAFVQFRGTAVPEPSAALGGAAALLALAAVRRHRSHTSTGA